VPRSDARDRPAPEIEEIQMDGEKKATAATPEGTCVVCGKTEAPEAPVKWADQTRRLCEGCVDGELARLAEERKSKRKGLTAAERDKRGLPPILKRAGKTKAAKPEAGEAATAETTTGTTTDTNTQNKETEMAKTKKTPKTPKAKAERKPKAPKAQKPERKKLGEVALVMRVSKEALAYIDQQAGDRPRTAWLRDVLGKGDARLGRMLEPA